MTTQNQINLCIAYLNEISATVCRVEIGKAGTAYVFYTPTTYVTVFSVYSDEQLAYLNDNYVETLLIEGTTNKSIYEQA